MPTSNRPSHRVPRAFAAAAVAAALSAGLLGPALPAPAFAAPKEAPAESLAAAQALIDAGDPDGALRLVDPILKRDKKNAAALLIRSTAECMVGDVEPCKQDLDRALALDPKLRRGWLNLSALAIAESRWDDALRALAKAEALDPAAPDNAINRGAVYLLKGDLEPATADFRRHLERQPGNAEGWYLVATNYANAGYAALAIEHLAKAIALDERARVRARADPNFGELAANRTFQDLLATDSWRPPPGTATAERTFKSRYVGSESPILVAVLNVLQLSGAPLDPRVEVTADWALFWAQYRIKLVRNTDDSTTVRLFSLPAHYFAPTWESSTAEFFRAVEMQLLKLEFAAGRQSPGGR